MNNLPQLDKCRFVSDHRSCRTEETFLHFAHNVHMINDDGTNKVNNSVNVCCATEDDAKAYEISLMSQLCEEKSTESSLPT